MRVACVAIFCLFVAVFVPSQEVAPCRCGTPLSSALKYSSVPSDGASPDPSIVKISAQNDQETLWVSFTSRAPNGDFLKQAATSQDDGHTWRLDPGYREIGLMGSERRPVVYEYNDHDLLRKSLDGGNHWIDCKYKIEGLSPRQFAKKVANGKPGTLHFGLAAIHPQDPATIYGTISVWVPSTSDPDTQEKTYDLPGIYVSYDGGDNWTVFASSLKGADPDEPAILGIDPVDPARILGHGKSGVVMTMDGGRSWKPVGQQAALEAPAEIEGRREAIAAKGPSGKSIPLYPRFSYLAVHQIEFDPANRNVIYLVTNKGLYKSEDAARTWCLVYAGTPALSELHSLVFDPVESNRLFLGSRERVLVSDDGGCNFRTLFDWDRYSGEMSTQ